MVARWRLPKRISVRRSNQPRKEHSISRSKARRAQIESIPRRRPSKSWSPRSPRMSRRSSMNPARSRSVRTRIPFLRKDVEQARQQSHGPSSTHDVSASRDARRLAARHGPIDRDVDGDDRVHDCAHARLGGLHRDRLVPCGASLARRPSRRIAQRAHSYLTASKTNE